MTPYLLLAGLAWSAIAAFLLLRHRSPGVVVLLVLAFGVEVGVVFAHRLGKAWMWDQDGWYYIVPYGLDDPMWIVSAAIEMVPAVLQAIVLAMVFAAALIARPVPDDPS